MLEQDKMDTSAVVEFVGVPLAVYREISAHLRQVTGVNATLIPQTSQQFDYNQSQIAGLSIEYPQFSTPETYQQVEEILTYYRNLYNA
jgi:hypothetical protein